MEWIRDTDVQYKRYELSTNKLWVLFFDIGSSRWVLYSKNYADFFHVFYDPDLENEMASELVKVMAYKMIHNGGHDKK
jgi:hypothetical protein